MTLFEPGVREPIALSELEFDVLWQHLDLGQLPLVLRVPSPGRTHTERAHLERRAWDGLEERGLGRPVQLDEELAAMLRLLADPAREVDGRLWLGRSVRVLAVAREEDGVLAVLDSGRLSLRAVSGLSLPREAVSVLPPRPAGPGRSVTLPSADLDAAAAACGNDLDRLGPELLARGIRAEDAGAISEMIKDAGDRGQFGVAATEQWERRRRGDRVIGFFDTPAGRYLQTRRGLDGAAAWSTIAPVDNRRLTQHLDEVLGELLSLS